MRAGEGGHTVANNLTRAPDPTTPDDRAQVLGQIRRALKTAQLPDSGELSVPRTTTGQGTRAEWIERFRVELEPLGGKAYLVPNDAEALQLILSILAGIQAREVLCWPDAALPLRGVREALRLSGYTSLEARLPHDPSGRANALLELERATAGITSALAGLADTGSIVLTSSPGRSRLASVLPATHIALLPVNALFPTLDAFLAANPGLVARSSNVVVITGPSRTADIELTLTRGVHGPRDLHVLLLSTDAPG